MDAHRPHALEDYHAYAWLSFNALSQLPTHAQGICDGVRTPCPPAQSDHIRPGASGRSCDWCRIPCLGLISSVSQRPCLDGLYHSGTTGFHFRSLKTASTCYPDFRGRRLKVRIVETCESSSGPFLINHCFGELPRTNNYRPAKEISCATNHHGYPSYFIPISKKYHVIVITFLP